MKTLRKWLIPILIIAFIAIAGIIFSRRRTQSLADAAVAAQDGETVTAFIGDLSASATASGQLEPQRDATLTMGVSGTADIVPVRVGDVVNAGDVLVQLDASALERAVASAEQNLVIQQASLRETKGSGTDADIASAEAQLASALANLEDLQDGTNANQIESSRATLRAANASVESAQASLAKLQEGVDPDDAKAARANVASAQAALNSANQQFQSVTDGATDSELASALANVRAAEAQVTTAQNTVDTLKRGPTASELAAAQSNVQAAEAGVKSAENNLQAVLDGASDAEIASGRASLTAAQQSQRSAQEFYDDVFTCYEQDDGYIHCPQEALQDTATDQLNIANQQLTAAQAALDSLMAGSDQQAITAAQANVDSARAQQDAAQKSLKALQDGDDDALANAQASLNSAVAQRSSAQAGLALLQDGATADQLAASTANIAAAQAQVDSSQANLDNLLEGVDSNDLASAQASVAQALANRDSAQANLDQLIDGSTGAQLAAAEAQVAQARAALSNLVNGGTDDRVAVAEAQVAQAQINLEEAQDNLSKAVLTAPFAGVITAVNVAPGEISSGPVIDIVDINTLAVVLDVDEIDLGSLEVGKSAIVTLDSFPDIEIPSEITYISPSGTKSASTGIVSYEVRVALGDTEVPVRIGMTANADLVTSERNGVVLVPNKAITADRSRGIFSVNRTTGSGETQEIEEVQVTIGLRDNQFTEIVTGVEEGDELLIGDFSVPAPVFGGPFGGGDDEG